VRLDLRAPVILMVLAATAIPVELKPPGSLGFSIQPLDVLANVAGYIPIGIVLARLSPLRAILAAAAISLFAESSQFVMVHRDPSVVDVVANVTGAILGTMIVARWKIRSTEVTLNPWKAIAAAALAVALILGVRAESGSALSTRGATTPGVLEGHWTFDEPDGNVVLDSSGHDLRGTFRHQPVRVAGMRGGAVAFDGAQDYIDFGHPQAFRLVGSLTISAWIKANSNPVDDAAIVSSMRHVGTNHDGDGFGVGFQLDTTIDRGPRTIGFKLANACGSLVARYGATPLLLDTWYHVAGVYDAKARTMDVYLNGKLDDGFLRGNVRGVRRSSRESLYVGRRSDLKGFEFAGAIDDVRLYSTALTQNEVAADVHGTSREDARVNSPRAASSDGAGLEMGQDAVCSWSSEREDARIPAVVAAVGVLLAVACVGLWPARGATLGLAASVVAGLVLFRVATPTLPSMNLWVFPLTSLAGAASVMASLWRPRTSDR
jgi:VanZ family protein